MNTLRPKVLSKSVSIPKDNGTDILNYHMYQDADEKQEGSDRRNKYNTKKPSKKTTKKSNKKPVNTVQKTVKQRIKKSQKT